jgi:hypothetical protein
VSTQTTNFHELDAIAGAVFDLAPLTRALDAIAFSPEAPEVYTSVARLCVPLIADAAAVSLNSAEQSHRIDWPLTAEDGQAASAARETGAAHWLETPIDIEETATFPAYRGVLTLGFVHSAPSSDHPLIAVLIVERANAMIERARSAALSSTLHAKVENLETALGTNREIGTAMGILMASHKLSRDQSFDLLRRVSQNSHVKLRDVAVEVADTGAVELPEGVSLFEAPTRTKIISGRSHPRPPTPCVLRPDRGL